MVVVKPASKGHMDCAVRSMRSASREKSVRASLVRPHTSANVMRVLCASWTDATERSGAGSVLRPQTSSGDFRWPYDQVRLQRLSKAPSDWAVQDRDPCFSIPGRCPSIAHPPAAGEHAGDCEWKESGLFFQSQGAGPRPLENAPGRQEPPSPAQGGDVEQDPAPFAHSEEVKHLMAANAELQRRMLEAENRLAVAVVEAKKSAHRAVSGDITYLVSENEDLKRQLAEARKEASGRPRTLMTLKVSKGFACLQDQDRAAALQKELDLVKPALREALRYGDHLRLQLQDSLDEVNNLKSELDERSKQIDFLRAQERRAATFSNIAPVLSDLVKSEQA
jgi:hypothetical protein